jgi:hypothetical protein
MMRQICGAFRTTPVRALNNIASIPPLPLYIQYLQDCFARRLKMLPASANLLARLPDDWRVGNHITDTPQDSYRSLKITTNLRRIASATPGVDQSVGGRASFCIACFPAGRLPTLAATLQDNEGALWEEGGFWAPHAAHNWAWL